MVVLTAKVLPRQRCGAFSATSVQNDLVAFQQKSRRRQALHVSGTTTNLKHTGATAALEMVMVPPARPLVPWRVPRQLDRVEPSALDQRVDGPIDGRDAQPL